MSRLSEYFPEVTANAYNPPLLDWQAGHQSNSPPITGNKFTLICRFRTPAFTDANQYQALFSIPGSGSQYRPLITVRDDTNATAEERNKLWVGVANTGGTYLAMFLSKSVVADNALHNLLFAFDGDNGLATFIMDGVDEDDLTFTSRVTPTAGTLATGNVSCVVASLRTNLARYYKGDLGFIGYDDQYITDYSLFFESDGQPREVDPTAWGSSGWGAQPLFFNPYGCLINNLGSESNFVGSGTHPAVVSA